MIGICFKNASVPMNKSFENQWGFGHVSYGRRIVLFVHYVNHYVHVGSSNFVDRYNEEGLCDEDSSTIKKDSGKVYAEDD